MATRSHSKSSYSVLLLQKLLSLRDGVSPLTLVLDTPREQGTPLLEEMMLRAKVGAGLGVDKVRTRTKVIYVCSGLAPRRQSPHVDVYIERRDEPSLEVLQERILKEVPTQAQTSTSTNRCLIVIDSLGPIAQSDPLFVAAFVSSLVSPTTAVVGLYRTDNFASSGQLPLSPALQGKPHPYKVLSHLATAVLRISPLDEEVARKRARDRAEEVPRFGWAEGEGFPFAYHNWRYSKRDLMVAALSGNESVAADIDRRGILVDMELRRRSGRAVVERYVMVLGGAGGAGAKAAGAGASTSINGKMPWQKGAVPCTDITVMGDHPLFAVPDLEGFKRDGDEGEDSGEDLPTSTFNLGLTDKQRKDREGIVLPYFDAQTDIGAGEGGRILYDLGREDDFDDEEDESWEG